MTEAQSSHSAPQEQTLSLDFLTKLMPENFDGDRYRLRSFIKQVDAVFELARPHQVQPLLLFVKSKIIGRAREQIDIHCNLTSWEEISNLLIQLYQDKRSLDQLLEQLNTIKQFHNENVSSFYQRLEELSSRILGIIHATEENPERLRGRQYMIRDMTLNRFTYHTHPQISQMLRYREFNNINSALTAALAEEKALHHYNTNHSPNKNKPNNFIANKNFNHTNKNIHFTQPPNHTSIKKCNYCKNLGHTIDECRKRKYNNDRKKQLSQQHTIKQTESTQNGNQNFFIAPKQAAPPIEIESITDQFANL